MQSIQEHCFSAAARAEICTGLFLDSMSVTFIDASSTCDRTLIILTGLLATVVMIFAWTVSAKMKEKADGGGSKEIENRIHDRSIESSGDSGSDNCGSSSNGIVANERSTEPVEYLRTARTEYIFQGTDRNRHILNILQQSVGDYIPPWWYSSHLGTCVGFGKDLNLQFEQDVFDAEESLFSLDWYPYRPKPLPSLESYSNDAASTELDDGDATNLNLQKHNIIVLFPGLGLSSQSAFAQKFCWYAASRGYFVAVCNARGVLHSLKSSRFWHPADNDDAILVLDYLYHSYQRTARFFLAGYSAGTNILQKTLLHVKRREEELDRVCCSGREKLDGAKNAFCSSLPCDNDDECPEPWRHVEDTMATVKITRTVSERDGLSTLYESASENIKRDSRKIQGIYPNISLNTGTDIQGVIKFRGDSRSSPGTTSPASSIVSAAEEEVLQFTPCPVEGTIMRRASYISGALCVCVTYNYAAARDRLESTLLGSIYSRLMTGLYKQIVLKNSHVHDHVPGGPEFVKALLDSCTYLSDYDKTMGKHLHGFEWSNQLNAQLSMFDSHEIPVPLVALQPRDDPLHAGAVRENILVEKLVSNPNIIYMETQEGNHFGFYEGGIMGAFSHNHSYTYPAKVAVGIFDAIAQLE